MSTRAVIARPTNDTGGFAGRYHHFDGYPTGLGATLYWLYHSIFGRDLERMLKTLLDDHTGWSSVEGDWTQDPGFVEYGSGTCRCGEPSNEHLCQYIANHGDPLPCSAGMPTSVYSMHLGHTFVADEATERQAERPKCYCHGDRNEEGWTITDEDAADSGCEFAYVLKSTPDGNVMQIFEVVHGEGLREIGVVGLDTNETPDFTKIEEAA